MDTLILELFPAPDGVDIQTWWDWLMAAIATGEIIIM